MTGAYIIMDRAAFILLMGLTNVFTTLIAALTAIYLPMPLTVILIPAISGTGTLIITFLATEAPPVMKNGPQPGS